MLKIGNIELRNEPVFLAPLEDVTDHPFRVLCKNHGADFMYTEFISSDALVRDVKTIRKKMQLYPDERPIGIQIYGRQIDAMVGAAQLAEEMKPELIDINFGCPVRKIATKGSGAGMLRDIPNLIAITKAVVEAVKIPVTVKTRLGWDDKSKVIVSLSEQLQDVGISALTIHGRTREQIYSGVADWTLIGEVKNNQRMKIPIIGNGDIDSGEKARLMFDRYGVDGIMIGRAAIGNPHIFREVRHFLDTGESLPPLNISEQLTQLKLLIEKSIDWSGLPGGILHTRRHMALNFKGLPNFRTLRVKMLRSNTKEELWGVFDEIKKLYGE
ncbi:MAG: tRNA dihydrouridine synthase DusB [Bacteroidota bacterium]|nr:tRNA dihydrouridine synthase DusB [Bacteroidota bacterium]